MIIQYIDPLSRAWKRMKTILLGPFNMGKWFALGFTAFLAGLFNSPGGGGGGNFSQKSGHFDWSDFFEFPSKAMAWLSTHHFWLTVITIGLIIAIAVAVVLMWLSSRGMFMFLDNVVYNRSLIEKPWREFKTRGDSLFLWRLVFSIIAFSISIGFMVAIFFIARNIYFSGSGLNSILALILGILCIGLPLFLITFFISLFLKDFIVPIMFKTELTVNDAWRRFLALFGKHPGYFILYGLFIIGLWILVGIGIIIGGFLTCCCGFILLMIPYIKSVLMLPVSVTFRALSLEFLEQFGDEYKIFPTDSGDAGPVGSNDAGHVDAIDADFTFASDGDIDPVA
jgi:hypothetical protein